MTYYGKLPLSNSYMYDDGRYQAADMPYDYNVYRSNKQIFKKLSLTMNDPVAVYHFNDNILDSNGVTANDFSVHAGTPKYIKRNGIDEVQSALYIDGATRLVTTNNTNLLITGALTIQAVINYIDETPAATNLMDFGATGESLATNSLYLITQGTNREFGSFHESGSAGTDSYITFPASCVKTNEWFHFALTRTANSLTESLYLNGMLMETGYHSIPATGGTSCQLYFGGKVAGAILFSEAFFCDSLKIHNAELTAEQIYDEYAYAFNVSSSLIMPKNYKQHICDYISASTYNITTPGTASIFSIKLDEQYTNEIYLKALLSSNTTNNTASIKLYNINSGSYVYLTPNEQKLSVIGNTLSIVTSSNLLSMPNFNTSSIDNDNLYRLEIFGEGTNFSSSLYIAEIIYK